MTKITLTKARPKKYRSRNADERQSEIWRKFPADSFLANPTNVDHTMLWITFFRRNMHRFAMDYLGIKLHIYQIVMLYLMGINKFIVTIAARGSAKSFLIALYACCRCILYPHTKILIASSTKGQAKLIVSEKIEKELMNLSPALRKEISKVIVNENNISVEFRNGSSIKVVVANDNARGNRSNVIIREEFRMMKKEIDDSVLSPCQILRQTPYMLDAYYQKIPDLQEEPVDIYISSSWFDNGQSWMWDIVDKTYSDMSTGKSHSLLLAFDESIVLKHGIKSQNQLKVEKKKQDPLTWRIEFLNERVKENRSAFFPITLLQQNQTAKMPFYPRTTLDFKNGRKNPYDMPKQQGEIRIVSCDMAFIENTHNDNSIFSCMRLLPEFTTYNRDNSDIKVDNGFRRILNYMKSVQGGDTDMQAITIRRLYEDFEADYLVLDLRNAGISIYDKLAKVMYDEERGVEYTPLCCMNDDDIRNRIRNDGAIPCIYVINASQKLNSDIAMDFRRVLANNMIDLLIPFGQASEEILPNIKEYVTSPDADTQMFYESPFLETQSLISETTDLVYEKKDATGVIVIHEQGSNRKDRYTSVSYGSWFASQLEKDLEHTMEDYSFATFIN